MIIAVILLGSALVGVALGFAGVYWTLGHSTDVGHPL